MQRDIFKRLDRIDHFIRIKGTGTPAQFAGKVGLSERTMYSYLRLMKDFGAPVVYSRQKQSYYYLRDGRFIVRFLSE